MPCGSSIYTSPKTLPNTLEAKLSSFQGLGWFRKITLAWLEGIAMRWERRRQYRQLLELDDRMLADIGLSRTIAKEVRRSDLYMVAWRDSR
jgi:uncharacterized protein YjiS (DUF1127 family)